VLQLCGCVVDGPSQQAAVVTWPVRPGGAGGNSGRATAAAASPALADDGSDDDSSAWIAQCEEAACLLRTRLRQSQEQHGDGHSPVTALPPSALLEHGAPGFLPRFFPLQCDGVASDAMRAAAAEFVRTYVVPLLRDSGGASGRMLRQRLLWPAVLEKHPLLRCFAAAAASPMKSVDGRASVPGGGADDGGEASNVAATLRQRSVCLESLLVYGASVGLMMCRPASDGDAFSSSVARGGVVWALPAHAAFPASDENAVNPREAGEEEGGIDGKDCRFSSSALPALPTSVVSLFALAEDQRRRSRCDAEDEDASHQNGTNDLASASFGSAQGDDAVSLRFAAFLRDSVLRSVERGEAGVLPVRETSSHISDILVWRTAPSRTTGGGMSSHS
jgi:hypothetical protein